MSSKTKGREKIVSDIINIMKGHEFFSSNVKRKDDESTIQKALFLRLEKGKELQKILLENKVVNTTEKAEKIALKNFSYEQDSNTSVKQFITFGTQHRPDAVIDLGSFRIAIEIKKGTNGSSVRSGLGQSLLYSSEYDFVIFFLVDTTDGLNIKNSVTGEKEQNIISDLWNRYNVKFVVV